MPVSCLPGEGVDRGSESRDVGAAVTDRSSGDSLAVIDFGGLLGGNVRVSAVLIEDVAYRSFREFEPHTLTEIVQH